MYTELKSKSLSALQSSWLLLENGERQSEKGEPLSDFNLGNHNIMAVIFYGERWNYGVQAGLEKRDW